jgi:hypothetical protein
METVRRLCGGDLFLGHPAVLLTLTRLLEALALALFLFTVALTTENRNIS